MTPRSFQYRKNINYMIRNSKSHQLSSKQTLHLAVCDFYVYFFYIPSNPPTFFFRPFLTTFFICILTHFLLFFYDPKYLSALKAAPAQQQQQISLKLKSKKMKINHNRRLFSVCNKKRWSRWKSRNKFEM